MIRDHYTVAAALLLPKIWHYHIQKLRTLILQQISYKKRNPWHKLYDMNREVLEDAV